MGFEYLGRAFFVMMGVCVLIGLAAGAGIVLLVQWLM